MSFSKTTLATFALMLLAAAPRDAMATGYRYTATEDSVTAYVNTYWMPVQDHSVTLGLGNGGHFMMEVMVNPGATHLSIDALFTDLIDADSTHDMLPYTGMHFTAEADLYDPHDGGSFQFDPATGDLELNAALNWDASMELLGLDLPPITMHYNSEPFIHAGSIGAQMVDLSLGIFTGQDGTGGPAPQGALHEMGISGQDVHFAHNPEPSTIMLAGAAVIMWRRRRRTLATS